MSSIFEVSWLFAQQHLHLWNSSILHIRPCLFIIFSHLFLTDFIFISLFINIFIKSIKRSKKDVKNQKKRFRMPAKTVCVRVPNFRCHNHGDVNDSTGKYQMWWLRSVQIIHFSLSLTIRKTKMTLPASKFVYVSCFRIFFLSFFSTWVCSGFFFFFFLLFGLRLRCIDLASLRGWLFFTLLHFHFHEHEQDRSLPLSSFFYNRKKKMDSRFLRWNSTLSKNLFSNTIYLFIIFKSFLSSTC